MVYDEITGKSKSSSFIKCICRIDKHLWQVIVLELGLNRSVKQETVFDMYSRKIEEERVINEQNFNLICFLQTWNFDSFFEVKLDYKSIFVEICDVPVKVEVSFPIVLFFLIYIYFNGFP